MADKNKPDRGNHGGFEQDDPFAELARLIGPRDGEPPRDAPYAPETAEDLTDELLREFESLSAHAQPSTEPQAPHQPAPRSGPDHEPEPPFESGEGFYFEEPEAPAPRPASIWDELPAAPAPEQADTPVFSGMRDTISGYQAREDIAPRPVMPQPQEPVREAAPHPLEEAAPGYKAEQAAEEHDLDLDLDEIALELSELDLPEEGQGPLDDVAAVEVDRDDDFDPAALISTEEPPQPVDELDLPRMGDDEVVPVRASPDPYEFDLDEELADVLASQPALVDPLQDPPLEQELPEEQVYYPTGAGAAYEQAYEQAAAPRNSYQEELSDFDNASDEDYYDVDDRERRAGVLTSGLGGTGRAVLIGGGVVVIAVLAVFAGMRYFSGEGGGEPVVITADKSSVKEAPEDPGGEVVPNQDNAVFNDVSGTLAEAPRQDSLIASNQEPTDVESVAPNPLAASAASGSGATDTGGLEPRKVRTVIVRPDGTLVEREPLQISRPASTGVSGPATASPEESGQSLVSQEAGAESGDGAGGTPPAPAAPADDAATGTDAAEAPPVEDFGIANVPLPTRRPAGGAPARVAAATPAAATTPAPAAAAPQATAQSGSAYAMQIASLPSEQEAQQAYRRLAAQYPAVLGRRAVEIVPATIAGKGTFYRVRIPASSLSEALSLCESFKAQGGSCFVPR